MEQQPTQQTQPTGPTGPTTGTPGNATLGDLQQTIVSQSGPVTAEQASQLRGLIFADSEVDRQEADALFAINDATTKRQGNSPRWNALFVEGVVAHVTEDAGSPGEVDESEGSWLLGKIQGDGELDSNERVLLGTLRARATGMHSSVQSFINQYSI